MSTRRSTGPKRCLVCKIHTTHCFCHELRKLDTKTKISFVMHHREEHLTSNTVNLALLTLNNAEVKLRGLPEAPFHISQLDIDKEKTLPLFLFPSLDAIELNDENLAQMNPKHLPIHLIIPDGTWTQAKKVYRRDFINYEDPKNKILTVKLPMGYLGEYKLRKSPRENGLSTFEACTHAIAIIEKNQKLEEELMTMFKIMVERMIKTRRNFHGKEDFLTNTFKSDNISQED